MPVFENRVTGMFQPVQKHMFLFKVYQYFTSFWFSSLKAMVLQLRTPAKQGRFSRGRFLMLQ